MFKKSICLLGNQVHAVVFDRGERLTYTSGCCVALPFCWFLRPQLASGTRGYCGASWTNMRRMSLMTCFAACSS